MFVSKINKLGPTLVYFVYFASKGKIGTFADDATSVAFTADQSGDERNELNEGRRQLLDFKGEPFSSPHTK
jgi:hypothetical protein